MLKISAESLILFENMPNVVFKEYKLSYGLDNRVRC